MFLKRRRLEPVIVKVKRRKVVIKDFNLVNSGITLSFKDREASIEGSPYGGQNDYVSKNK